MGDYLETYRRTWKFGIDEWVPCEVCGGTAADIHHIQYRSRLGGDEFANLIALCRRCHGRAHGNDLTADQLRDAKKWPAIG